MNGDAPARITGGLGAVVVGLDMDDHRATDHAGNAWRKTQTCHHKLLFGHALGIGLQCRQVASVVWGALRPVRLAIGIEVAAGAAFLRPWPGLAGRPRRSRRRATS